MARHAARGPRTACSGAGSATGSPVCVASRSRLVLDAEADLLGFYAFPASTGPSCAARTRWSA
jgi:hypothetical protein